MAKSKLLQIIETQRPHKKQELAKILNIRNKEKKDFYRILDEMEKENLIFCDEKGRYRIIDEERYVYGEIQTHGKGFGFLLQKDSDDIFVSESNLNNALNGDEVIVKKYKDTSGDRPEGKVIKITRRKNTTVVGTFQDRRNFGFVLPDENKLAQDIYIPKKGINKAREGQKVVAEITKWPAKDRKPEGKIIEVIGYPKDPRVDILSIARSLDIPMEFSPKALKEAEKINQEVSPKDLKGRRDLRSWVTFTIDGAGSKDFDDAVSIEKLDNGNYYLGVHIADVSHYVQAHSSLDKEAFKRGNSVYLLNEVIPMLPEELSNGICSLNEGVDRLTMSCLMEVNQKGKVIDHSIEKTVINSCRRLVYDHVSDFLEKGISHKSIQGLEEDLTLMGALSQQLQKVRHERGAIDFEIPEPLIELNERGWPISIEKEKRRSANRLIEDFMLLANQTVAEHFYWLEIPFIYRIHEEPEEDRMEALRQYMRPLGYKVGHGDEIYPRDLQQLVEAAEGKKEELFVSMMALRSMQKAKYSAENDIHFGLAYKYYTHFTSPIRRYSDLTVHRLIGDFQNHQLKGKNRQKWSDTLPEIAEHVSVTERRAQDAERQVESVKMAEYMSNRIGEQYEGIISGITNFGFFVQLDNLIEGLVSYQNMEGYIEFDEKEFTAHNRKTGQKYKMGDVIKVEVANADITQGNIDFTLVGDKYGKEKQ